MVCYPEVQKKAQAELASVVGSDRLPDFDIRDQLPYINAIVKETMRWQPVTPLGMLSTSAFGVKLTYVLAIPHYTEAGDIYNGQYIPAGSIIMANAWYAVFRLVLFRCLFTDTGAYRSMLHDPVVYPNPSEFKPERFLKEDGTLNPDAKDPGAFAFGFGRRICPGRFFSDSSLYSIITSILSVYELLPPLDQRGNVVTLEPQWSTGLVQYPLPFKCRIKPKSKAAEDLIKHSGDHYA
jgi:hypothetical protein